MDFKYWYNNKLETLKWSMVIPNSELPKKRFGHSACLFGDNIYIYGGSMSIDSLDEVENILVYSLSTNRFYDQWMINSKQVEFRRNHICHCIGFDMLIYGGVNLQGQVLNDIAILNLLTLKWEIAEINENIPFLREAASALVTRTDRMIKGSPKFGVYQTPEDLKESDVREII